MLVVDIQYPAVLFSLGVFVSICTSEAPAQLGSRNAASYSNSSLGFLREAFHLLSRCGSLLCVQLYEARRAAKEAEREAQEAAQEAEIARAAAERAKREEEEAAKWMHMFTVEEAGEDALSEEAGEVRIVITRYLY